MSGNPETACPRCGIRRQVHTSGKRSGYCQDCTSQRGQDTTSRRWMDDAACTTVDPAIFFPDESTGWRPVRDAKAVCASCPVRRQCLEDSPVWDRFSVRGGLTATERARARSRDVA